MSVWDVGWDWVDVVPATRVRRFPAVRREDFCTGLDVHLRFFERFANLFEPLTVLRFTLKEEEV